MELKNQIDEAGHKIIKMIRIALKIRVARTDQSPTTTSRTDQNRIWSSFLGELMLCLKFPKVSKIKLKYKALGNFELKDWIDWPTLRSLRIYPTSWSCFNWYNVCTAIRPAVPGVSNLFGINCRSDQMLFPYSVVSMNENCNLSFPIS